MSESNDFFQVGGNLAPDAPSYIERPADHELLAALEQHEFCLVLAPRQTGKSSLMIHAVARLREKGIHAGIVDLQPLGSHQEPDRLFSDMIYQIERSLRLKTDSAEWEEAHVRLGPTQRFMTFLEDVVLTEKHGDVVLFFDEIDSALKLPFSDDFFTTLRSLYNARADNPILRRLSLVLLGLATASSFIQDRTRTPFNIGRSIALNDFDRVATKPFDDKLGQNSRPLIDRIFYWTNGQPLLVQRLASTVYKWPLGERSPERIDEEVKRSYLQSNIEQDTHFQFIQNYLLDASHPRKTLGTYQQVLQGKIIAANESSPIQNHLKLAGVVRILGNRLVVRNRMYEHIFDLNWVREHAPRSIKKMLVYGITSFSAMILLWIYVVQPLLFPFLYLARTLRIIKYTPDPSVEIEVQTEHVRRAFLEQEEVLVPQNRVIRSTLSGFMPGNQTYELKLIGGLFKQSYKIPIDVTYYPSWEIRHFQEASSPEYAPLDGAAVRDAAAVDGHSREVYFVAFSPDGKTVVSGSEDRTLKLWEVKSGRVLRTFSDHKDAVIGVAFSPDGQRVLSGSLDGTLKLWEVETGKMLRTFIGHEQGVLSVAFSPDGKRVLSGSQDGTLKLWEVREDRELHTFTDHDEAVTGVAFSPDGQQVLSGSQDRTLKLWDVNTREVLRTFTGHTEGVTGVAFSPDGERVLSGSEDSTLKLWDVHTGQGLRTFKGHAEGVIGVAFAPDGRTVMSASDDHTLRLWDVSTPTTRRLFKGHTQGVIGVAFHPKHGRTVISGSQDRTLKLWWAAVEPR